MLSSIPGSCPLFRDVVQHSGQDPKIGQLQNGINDIFDRIRPTTSNGMPRQLQTEWPDNIERHTHLRHEMVVNRILEWYRAGINPQERLPFLATYLGHRDIHSTLSYITVTQDLLQQAGERFHKMGAHCLHVTEGVQP